MKPEPISLADLFGLNGAEFAEWSSHYDLYSDFDVVPSPDTLVGERVRRSFFSYLRSGYDCVDAAICAGASWIIEGFVTGLALYGCGHALVDSSVWPLGDCGDERSKSEDPCKIINSPVKG